MTVVAFYEPSYVDSNRETWSLRAGYKYSGLLDATVGLAEPIIAMDAIPPADDPLRRRLEEMYGAVFVEVTGDLGLHQTRDAFGIAQNLANALEKFRPNIVSNMNGRKIHWCYASALAAEMLGADYVYRVGGDDIATELAVCDGDLKAFLGTMKYWDAIQGERLTVARARTIIAMSPWEKRRIGTMCDDADRIVVCPRGVDSEIFAPREFPTSLKRLLFVGRNSHEKGFDILRSAASQLAQARPDLEFLVAGPFAAGKDGNITYLGYVEQNDLPSLYASADAVVLCSRTEGMPQVVMEAMTSGRACILSRHLFEGMFVHGEQALLTLTNPSDLVSQITALADNPSLAAQLGRASREYAVANFSHRVALENYRQALFG
jgi:glycosyltransferase involved in cell wall biosynthesis